MPGASPMRATSELNGLSILGGVGKKKMGVALAQGTRGPILIFDLVLGIARHKKTDPPTNTYTPENSGK